MTDSTDQTVWDYALVDVVAPSIAGVAGAVDGQLIETFWVPDPDSIWFASGFVAPTMSTALAVVSMIERNLDPFTFGYTPRPTPAEVRRAFLTAERENLSDRIVNAQDDIREIDRELTATGGA